MIVYTLVMFSPTIHKDILGKGKRSLMLAPIRDATWNVLNTQNITPNSKRWEYLDIPGYGPYNMKGSTDMVEGDPRNKPLTPAHFQTASNEITIWHWFQFNTKNKFRARGRDIFTMISKYQIAQNKNVWAHFYCMTAAHRTILYVTMFLANIWIRYRFFV